MMTKSDEPFTLDCSSHSIFTRWTGKDPETYVFTAQEERLMVAVSKALDLGLFYNSDVDEFVAKELEITAEQRSAQFQKPENAVHGGCFGYEVYHARKVVEARRSMKDNREAIEQYRYFVGQKLGRVKLNGKIVSGTVITAVSPDQIALTGTLGNRKCAATTEPRRLATVIEAGKAPTAVNR